MVEWAPKSAGIKTPSLDGPIAVKKEGVSNVNLVNSSRDLLRRQETISSCSLAIFLFKKDTF